MYNRVWHKDEFRNIMLQNENGPCPLLAAANALLLRGVITLPPSCVRTDIVSIEELATIFADRALQRSDANHLVSDANNKKNTPISIKEEEAILLRKKQSQYQVDELMQILPGLQYGMDINPKFTQGPEGYEFTKNLTAFDIMGVNLVHGWLIDPNDETTSRIIGSKTYNELVEIVVKKNDSEKEIKRLKDLIEQEKKDDKVSDVEESDWVKVSEAKATSNQQENLVNNIKSVSGSHVEQDINEIEKQCEKLEVVCKNGYVVDSFLYDTAHQLTTYGLIKLHEHVQEGDLCVFFRNNHFSTMTKFEGQLFLLVTDLGYADVDDVVWEKLDAINGNTDYYNSFFFKSEPREYILDSGPTLTPEQMIAQRGQSEMDYHLALSLANGTNSNDTQTEDEEARVIAAVSEISWNEWKGNARNSSNAPTDENEKDMLTSKTNFFDDTIERDRQLALSLQGQEASENLARRLQSEDLHQQQHVVANSSKKKNNSSSCIIS